MEKKNKTNKKSHISKTSVLGILAICISFSVVFSGCIDDNRSNPNKLFYSFEDGLEGWTPDGTDLSDPDINWSINVTDEQSYDGEHSLELYLNNLNDAGKIWVEKIFNASANTQYEVTISYMFGTSDYGDLNLFRIITGATSFDPEKASDLIFQDDTGHQSDNETGLVWLNKSYTLTVQTDESGDIYITLGVWGTWETHRTYYIDSVNISIKELSVDEAPDISGTWIITYYEWTGNITKTENVTLSQSNWTIQIDAPNETLCTGLLMKNTLSAPFDKSEYLITDCDFRGLGISYIYVINETSMITDLPLCENCNPAVFSKIP
jgi:hypothetical protein